MERQRRTLPAAGPRTRVGRLGPPLPREATRGFAAPSSLSPQAGMDGAPPAASPAGLSAYVVVSQLLGLTLLATTGAWLGRYRGGVAWHSPLQFNVHPLCMVLGMVFLQGDGEQDCRTSAPSRCSLQNPWSCSRAGSKGDKMVTNETGKMLQDPPHLRAAPLAVVGCRGGGGPPWMLICPLSGSSPGLPGLQARSQALHQGAARAAPRPGAGHRPRR